MSPKIGYIACDHAGVELKNLIKDQFDLEWVDFGTNSKEPVDFPDYADKVCEKFKDNPQDAIGVLICGSGQGMAIRANKFHNVRAALCWNVEVATLARQHNDANVLCIGARFLSTDVALKITRAFLTTEFEGGRHQIRVDKMNSDT